MRADEIGQELGIPWQIVPLNFVSVANWKFALGPSKAPNTATENQIRDADLLRLDGQWSCIDKRKNWSGLHFRHYKVSDATDTAVTDTAILFSGLQTLPTADRLNHFITGLENLTTNG